jgi:hypothetical protein
MKGFLIVLALNVLSVLAPVAALATNWTYTFNIPIDVERIAPGGSNLSIECITGDGTQEGFIIVLDNSGTYIGTIPITIQTSSPQHSYLCKFLRRYDADGNAPPASLQLPKNLLVGVKGSIPGIKLLPMKAYGPKTKILPMKER